MALLFADLLKINQLLSLSNILKLYCSSSVPVVFQLCDINKLSKIVQKSSFSIEKLKEMFSPLFES